MGWFTNKNCALNTRLRVLGLLFFVFMTSDKALAIKEGEVMPSVTIKGADAKTPLDWKGKVTVLNFWATWCDACKTELKEMNAEFKPLFERPDVLVAFVSLDKDTLQAKSYLIDTFGVDGLITKRIAHDETFQAADMLEVDSFPMTIILDKSGKVVKVHRGFKEGEGSTKALLEIARGL